VSPRERYVRELESRLPFALGLRGRVISEVREHLREGGEDALARFGSVDELAAELSRELRTRAAARASWLVPAVLVLLIFPLYVLPENTLPPAPWDTKPEYLAWKQHVAVGAFLAALAFAAIALVLGRVLPRLAVVPLACSVVGLGIAVVFSSIVAAQWVDAVPGTSASIMYAAVAMSAALLVVAVLLVAAVLPDGRNELSTD
jgi:hypothetical protein